MRKRLTEHDRTRLIRGSETATRILKNAGAQHIFRTWYMAVHPGGTAKIGDLVDSNLKSRLDNLYVCDCSVIPESWGLPPTLTFSPGGDTHLDRLGEASSQAPPPMKPARCS